MLVAFLDYYRATIQRQAANRDAAQLATAFPPSDLTLGGILKHPAYVEDRWFGAVLTGNPPEPPVEDKDIWEADRDWDRHSARDDHPDELRSLLTDAIARSNAHLAPVESLDALSVRKNHGTGEAFTLRWILVRMIEEYARHADFIRQSIDALISGIFERIWTRSEPTPDDLAKRASHELGRELCPPRT